jgi:hypothetical protein
VPYIEAVAGAPADHPGSSSDPAVRIERPFLLDVGAILLAGARSSFAPKPELPQGAAQRRPADPRPPGAFRQTLGVFVKRTIVPLRYQRPQDRLARRVDPQHTTAGVRLGTTTALRACLVAPEIHLERPTPNPRATTAGSKPASYASNTRSRRLAEYGLAIAASYLARKAASSTHAQDALQTQAKTALDNIKYSITHVDPVMAEIHATVKLLVESSSITELERFISTEFNAE